MKFSGSPYLFGMDPVWRHASEAVQFTNSLKMKMAVTLGVSQMTLGIVLKMRNASFFNDQLTLWHEALPEFLFFVSTVGYMVVLVFIKWATDWQHVHDALRGERTDGPTRLNALAAPHVPLLRTLLVACV